MISALALDFDGVIADTQDYHLRAWDIVLQNLGLSVPDLSRRILGQSPAQFLTSLGVPSSQQQELLLMKEHALVDLAASSPPALFQSVHRVVNALHGRYALAVVSSGERVFVEQVLRHHNVLHLFGAVIVGSDILHPKPHPDPYQACVAALRLPPRVIAAVEDTPQGVASARAAGLIAIGITNSVPASSLRGAEAVISDFSEIPATLSRLARSVY